MDVKGAPNQVLGGRTPQFNDQDQIVKSGNYCYSYFRVVSMDENKTELLKDYHESYSTHWYTTKQKKNKKFAWRRPIDMIESAWELNFGSLVEQLDPYLSRL